MAAFVQPSRWRQQSQQIVPLDLGNQIAKKLTAHFALNGHFRSSVNQVGSPVITAGPVFLAGASGIYAMGTGAGGINTGIMPARLGMTGAAPRTIVVEFNMPDATGPRALFSFGDSSSGNRTQYTLQINTDYRTVQLSTYGNDINYVPHTVGGTGARVWLAITYDGNLTIRFQSWSRLDSTGQIIYKTQTSTLAGLLNTGNTVPLNLMGGGTYTFTSMNSALYAAAFFGNTVLSDAELQSLYENQYQVMKAPAPRLWTAASASAAISGALSWTEGSDTSTLAAVVTDAGTLAWTEAGDVVSIAAAAIDRAAMLWTEGDDTASLAGVATDRASIAWTEQGDSAALTGTVASSAGPIAVSTALSWTEAGDTAALFALALDRSTLAWAEQGDTWALTAFATQPPVVTATVRFDPLPRNHGLKTVHFSN